MSQISLLTWITRSRECSVGTPRAKLGGMEVSDAQPGADRIRAGLRDLREGVESLEALLLLVGAPRLGRLGFDVPDTPYFPEGRLYEKLAAEDSDSAHARYNALIRKLVSFERAAECVKP